MDAVVLGLPLAGPCLVQNSPARRVPSHGTTLMGSSHAIDLVPVDAAGHSAPRGRRSLFGTELPDHFPGFGVPVLAPAAGRVVAALDGLPDQVARRSPFAQLPFVLGQSQRIRGGVSAMAGNHVIIELPGARAFVALAHLRRGSVDVRVGETIQLGARIGACGNSGNSTEPHVHLQVMDAVNPGLAQGVPFVFRAFRVRGMAYTSAVPAEGAIVEPPLD